MGYIVTLITSCHSTQETWVFNVVRDVAGQAHHARHVTA